MEQLFNADIFEFHHIPEMVTRHLVQPEPIILTYELKFVFFVACLSNLRFSHPTCSRLDASTPNPTPKAFDIPIEVDDVALKTKMQEAYLAITQSDTAEIQALEDKVSGGC